MVFLQKKLVAVLVTLSLVGLTGVAQAETAGPGRSSADDSSDVETTNAERIAARKAAKAAEKAERVAARKAKAAARKAVKLARRKAKAAARKAKRITARKARRNKIVIPDIDTGSTGSGNGSAPSAQSVPELSSSGSMSAIALLMGTGLLLSGRRRRTAKEK